LAPRIGQSIISAPLIISPHSLTAVSGRGAFRR